MNPKYLKYINEVNDIFNEVENSEAAIQKICFKLAQNFSHPQHTCVRIKIGNKKFCTDNFRETRWILKEPFVLKGKVKASIDVFYLKEFPQKDENVFCSSERKMLSWTKDLIIEEYGKCFQKNSSQKINESENDDKLLEDFLDKNNYEREIYHDLMVYKVKEILLIANLYDAYNIEREGNFTQQILGDYINLNLTSFPRVTGVTSYEEARKRLQNKHFDMVIIMVGIDKDTPIEISRQIKSEYPYIPTYLLLNNNTDISLFEKVKEKDKNIDNIFVWNGDSRVFFTIVKLLEDSINLENDVKIGHTRIILLVEDSAKYYSRYLPLLYQSVMYQTKRIIEDRYAKDSISQILSLRLRPKILLVSNFEQAKNIFDKYKENFLSLITDVEYFKDGKKCKTAGFQLAEYIKSSKPMHDIPVIIQSSNTYNRKRAFEMNCSFIDKNSETLIDDIKNIIRYNMGFGDFYYYDSKGNKLDFVARNLKEFEDNLHSLPMDSIVYHSTRNHFSLWLMARGETRVADLLSPIKVEDFGEIQDLRKFLISALRRNDHERNKGRIIDYDRRRRLDESNIVSLAQGALGGKGRGIAFIHTLIHKYGVAEHFPEINIKTPFTFIIGTEAYDEFLEQNNLRHKIFKNIPYEELRDLFLQAKLPKGLVRKIRRLLRFLNNPLAVRSSGLFEDSLMQPFAGIFETYIVPNSHPDREIRLNQIRQAIKLVYASVFAEKSRSYIKAINYKVEEEKMAIVLQEVVGSKHGDYFYPHISGVAQSYNYYPFSHIEPEDGFANIAIGLGTYVVEGEKSYRFCPKYPTIRNYSPKDLFRNSQLEFYAVNLKSDNLTLSQGENAALKRLDLYDAEKHGTLKHLASVYDKDADRIIPGIDRPGARVVDFANVLKYNYIPLAKTISKMLEIGQEAIGSPVEIEFAVDLNKDKDYKASFYLLQIKALIGNSESYEIDTKNIDHSQTIMFTNKGMGNGLIDDICDVIYVDKATFDKSKTIEIGKQIAKLNEKMVAENRKYILIGPGRWGTRDRWIGIPIEWSQISNAKIIIETSLEGYPLDASLGSHFFHNVISMNVGYFSVQHNKKNHILAWDKLAEQKIMNQTQFVKHICFDKPLTIRMDGKQRISLISM